MHVFIYYYIPSFPCFSSLCSSSTTLSNSSDFFSASSDASYNNEQAGDIELNAMYPETANLQHI